MIRVLITTFLLFCSSFAYSNLSKPEMLKILKQVVDRDPDACPTFVADSFKKNGNISVLVASADQGSCPTLSWGTKILVSSPKGVFELDGSRVSDLKKISGNSIYFEETVYGENDLPCCPSSTKKATYSWSDKVNNFVLKGNSKVVGKRIF